MKEAVILLAHGAPESLEEIPAYLTQIRGGRPAASQLIEEITRRYSEIGGASPLLSHTRAQAEALQRSLSVPVYIGMRNWQPFIADTLHQMVSDGIERIVAICMAPQYSKLSTGLYLQRTEQAIQTLARKPEITWTGSYHDHPLLIEAFRSKLEPLLPAEMVLFTAHSLPEKLLADGDPYDMETKATARAVAARTALKQWDFAYQSQGMTNDIWLGPRVESRLDDYADRGIKEVILAPIGFVCDHMEILYDVDMQFRDYALQKGINLRRPESLNNSPEFVAVLADVVRQKLGKV